jgi:hypothetical protein
MAAVGTALLAVQTGMNLYNAFAGASKRRRQKRGKRRFFDQELAPLLNEATQEQDVDYDSLYDAEIQMPLMNLQEGFRSISKSRNTAQGQSGFQSSGFIDNDYTNSSKVLQGQFENQQFGVQRGLIDLQSQIESMATENKIRAKELEYNYKYG